MELPYSRASTRSLEDALNMRLVPKRSRLSIALRVVNATMFPRHSRGFRLLSPAVVRNYDRVSMAEKSPKSHLSSTRSAFSLIDPSTSLFHRQIDRRAYLTSGFRTHVAISYVWSEGRHNASDKLPSWPALQKRLVSVLGEHAVPDIKAVTGKATRCWLDCMCIDQESREDRSYWIP
jgi:hypothetical protein